MTCDLTKPIFTDEAAAVAHMEADRWPNGAFCPLCGADNVTKMAHGKQAGMFQCNGCKDKFTIRTGTIFERSHIPLHKWLYAMYLLVTARKGISSLQLSKEIGVTQKSAWFMLHRLREACGDDLPALRGIIEVDETYIGGKETAKHQEKKLLAGRGSVGKTGVVGLRERGGNTVAKPFASPDKATLHGAILDHVEIGSMIHTDDAPVYSGLDGLLYRHKSVNHSAGDYVKDGVTTNSIDSVWALLKRGLYGVYHHASPKHLGRYVNEFTFRMNDGNCHRQTLQRLDSFVTSAAKKRLTYADLTASRELSI
jgi:transposase-like protein